MPPSPYSPKSWLPNSVASIQILQVLKLCYFSLPFQHSQSYFLFQFHSSWSSRCSSDPHPRPSIPATSSSGFRQSQTPTKTLVCPVSNRPKLHRNPPVPNHIHSFVRIRDIIGAISGFVEKLFHSD